MGLGDIKDTLEFLVEAVAIIQTYLFLMKHALLIIAVSMIGILVTTIIGVFRIFRISKLLKGQEVTHQMIETMRRDMDRFASP